MRTGRNKLLTEQWHTFSYNVAIAMIYLDNNSTTPVDAVAIDAMTRCMREDWGNPSSSHAAGQRARRAVEHAREQVATLIGSRPREIIFTSGGTEADNLAILGTLAANTTRRHVILSAVEHAAVYTLCERLAAEGYRISFAPVDASGALDCAALESLVDADTALVSVMLANNETGVIMDAARAAAIAHAAGAVLLVDAVQAIGKVPVDVNAIGADLLAISAHKFHGPKGVGALYVKPGTRLRSQHVGGHQERDIRPGTENAAGIVGMGAAAEVAARELAKAPQSVSKLRDKFESAILMAIPGAVVNGGGAPRLCNTTNIAFPGVEAEALIIALSEAGICVSAGSACASGSVEPSHVLKAMGVAPALARGSIRFSLSRLTTDAEIASAIEHVIRAAVRVSRLVTTS